MDKVILTHEQVLKQCYSMGETIKKATGNSPNDLIVYPVPRGGVPVAYLLKSLYPTMTICSDVCDADVVIDDIIDSGATRKRYIDFPFVGLIDKRKNPDIGWVVFPWEQTEEKSVEDVVTRQLQFIGEDATREGLAETPERVVRSWDRLYGGYKKNPKDVLKTFDSDGYDQIVLLKDIEMYSTCEHHLLPFFGKCHIAYIPNKRVIGISKLARLMEIYSRRLQIQERIGEQITSILMEHLGAQAAACIIEAQHFCMRARGVEKQNSVMTTSSMKGVFLTEPAARNELLGLIKG